MEQSGPSQQFASPPQAAPPQSLPQQAQQPPQQGGDQPMSEGREKKKGKKRVGKKAEPQPLVGMFNESVGRYDAPVSIRQVLQNNKVDIT